MRLFSNPVLILKAECDYLPWQNTYEYKDLFPNAKLKVVKNAGHSIFIENRTDYIYEILNFLEEDN
jgi:proline iminopeptidase